MSKRGQQVTRVQIRIDPSKPRVSRAIRTRFNRWTSRPKSEEKPAHDSWWLRATSREDFYRQAQEEASRINQGPGAAYSPKEGTD